MCHVSPCPALSGILADKQGPAGVGPSVCRRAIRDSLSRWPCLISPVTHRYTTAIRLGAEHSRTAIRAMHDEPPKDAELIVQNCWLHPASQDLVSCPNPSAKSSLPHRNFRTPIASRSAYRSRNGRLHRNLVPAVAATMIDSPTCRSPTVHTSGYIEEQTRDRN